eukprot:365630-Chlamydomonas_euryale.AAC.7
MAIGVGVGRRPDERSSRRRKAWPAIGQGQATSGARGGVHPRGPGMKGRRGRGVKGGAALREVTPLLRCGGL